MNKTIRDAKKHVAIMHGDKRTATSLQTSLISLSTVFLYSVMTSFFPASVSLASRLLNTRYDDLEEGMAIRGGGGGEEGVTETVKEGGGGGGGEGGERGRR